MIRDTIKKHEDFLMTPDDMTAKSGFFLARAKPTLFPGDARYGLVATKKTFKLAVHRNRAKRLLRDWIAHHEKMMMPDYDYVFIARPSILTATRTDGRTAMRKALHYLARMRKQSDAE